VEMIKEDRLSSENNSKKSEGEKVWKI